MQKYSSTLITEIFNSPFAERFYDALKETTETNEYTWYFNLIAEKEVDNCLKTGKKIDIRIIYQDLSVVINNEYERGHVKIPEYIIKQYFEYKDNSASN